MPEYQSTNAGAKNKNRVAAIPITGALYGRAPTCAIEKMSFDNDF